VDSASVAAKLGLGKDYEAWLESLETLGAPPGGVRTLDATQSEALLRDLGVADDDLVDILETLPRVGGQPELWWLLERAYHGVLQDIGHLDAMRRTPSLPVELGVQGRLFWVFVYLVAVDHLRRWHREHGVTDQVSIDTLADLGQHVRLYRRRTGSVGFDTQWWLSLHFRGGLFTLGRLQFNPYRLSTGPAGPLFWYDAETIESLGPRFRPGEPVLGVHIPESGPLTPADCDASFNAARTFFAERFPEHASSIATCTSWLLDDQLLAYLDPDSNIVRFQQRFTLVPGARDADYSPLQFVFSRGIDALAEIVPRTRLERALVRHLAEGGHWRMRTGWLAL
jgi:hypothetical protein